MRRSSAVAATLLAAAASAAEPVLTVAAIGDVQIERIGGAAVAPPAGGAVAAWLAPAGVRVAAGEPIARFDMSVMALRIAEQESDLAVARGQLDATLQKLEVEIGQVRDGILAAKADEALLRQRLERSRAGDPAVRDNARLRVEAAELRLRIAVSHRDLTAAESDRGMVPAMRVAAADDAVARAQADLAMTRADALSQGRPAEPAAIARLESDLAETVLKAAQPLPEIPREDAGGGRPRSRGEGRPAAAVPPAGSGPPSAGGPPRGGGRRRGGGDGGGGGDASTGESLLVQLRRERQNRTAEVERQEQALQELRRDAGDRTPLATVAIDGGAAERFADTGAGAWSGAPVQLLGPPARRIALVGEPARWSRPVPVGTHRVALTLGGNGTWDGAQVAVEGVRVALPARIAEEHAVELEVTVADGVLDIDAGSAAGAGVRTLVAPVGGVVLPGDGVVRGWKSGGVEPCLWVVAESAATVRLLLPPALAALCAGRADGPQARLHGVALRLDDGSLIPAEVVTVGSQALPPVRGPDLGQVDEQDRSVREVVVRPTAAHGVPLRGRVRVELTLAGDGISVLAPHLATAVDGTWIVEDATGRRPVAAWRAGPALVVAGPVRNPRPPQSVPVESEGMYPGEVVPARRARVGIPWVWGRVESLVDDGAQVAVGDAILTVGNADIERNRERRDRDRAQALQNLALANERQAERARKLAEEHAARLAALTRAEAGLELERARDPGALPRAEAAATLQATLLRSAQRTLEATRAATPNDAWRAEAAVAQAQVRDERARLELAGTRLAGDWLALLAQRAEVATARAAVDRRELELAAARAEQLASMAADRQRYDQAVSGGWEARFDANRRIKAPMAGRVRWLSAWNDETKTNMRINRGFPVWGGMSIAEIEDRSQVAFQAQAPESLYGRLAEGARVEVEFASADGLRLPGRVAEIARAFLAPEGARGGDAALPVSDRRVIQVRVEFDDPAGAAQRLGGVTRGQLIVPQHGAP